MMHRRFLANINRLVMRDEGGIDDHFGGGLTSAIPRTMDQRYLPTHVCRVLLRRRTSSRPGLLLESSGFTRSHGVVGQSGEWSLVTMGDEGNC